MIRVNDVTLPEGSERVLMRALVTQKQQYLRRLNRPLTEGARVTNEKQVCVLDRLTSLLKRATGVKDPAPRAVRRRVSRRWSS